MLKSTSTLLCALAGTLLLLATQAWAQATINVGPGQAYTTIQSGINAAVNGDTVLVAPGTYNENINFNGKAITVTSSGGAASTTINGGNKPGIATVIIADGEFNAVISGFTITGGGDTIFTGNSDGGIFVNNGATPTIKNNIVTANYCHNIDVQSSVATILNNEISDVLESSGQTAADLSYCTFGSGLNLGGTNSLVNGLGTSVIGNTIENNITGGEGGVTGAGIFLWAAQNVLIMNNTIRNNTADYPGSAFSSANSGGTVIVQNLIYDNSSCAGAIAPEGEGGTVSNPSAFIANNTIVDNVANEANGASSACIAIAQIYPGPYSYGSSGPGIVIVNNIISGDTTYPAVNCSWFSTPSLTDQPTFENNILYNAGGPFFGSYCVDVSNQDNNIPADPQFVNPGADFHLKSTSPAIDSGQNSVLATFTAMTGLAWTLDAGGNPRVQNGSGKGCIIDMGIYEYTGPADQCGTSETLTSSLNPAPAGQSVTFTAQLSSTTGTPTGAVQFLDGTNLLSTQTVSGTGAASYSTSSLTVGSHTIIANYQPTGSFGASTASLTQVINGDPTSTALTCTPSSIDVGGTAQLTAAVTSASGTPTGSVSFADNGATLATPNLANGTAGLTYTGSVAGTHNIVASYIPTGPFAAGSASCSEVVNVLPTTSTLMVAPTTSTYGSPVTLTATVAPATLPGPSTPTGTVTFYNGNSSIGSGTLTGGVASLEISSLAGGNYSLTCSYGGSSVYGTSNCNSVPLTVNAAPTALTLSSSNNPAPFLGSIVFTTRLTVNGQSAGAGNAIVLNINGQAMNLSTDATGSATHLIGTLVPGSYPVVASFAATSDLQASSASLTEVVTALSTSTSLTATPNPGDVNQTVTMTATVSSGTSTQAESSSVSFFDGSTSLGSSQLSAAGTASVTASFSTAGVHNLTAVYQGNAGFMGSTSAVFQETIQAGDFTISATPAAAGVYTGVAAKAEVNIAILRGFDQALSLTCSGLPANTTCNFSPASLPDGQGASSLLIQTTAPHQVAAAASIPVLGALGLLFMPFFKRRRGFLAGLCAVLLAFGVAMGMSGCASANSITGGTPPGTYQVAVTATTTGTGTPLTHSAAVALTVKSLF
ncbi:MAG: Ig-like domain repeat protein [Terracidiphilus sp.]|jgi:hypothetical protein